MAKKRAALAGRAWSLLRLALQWARKGGIFKQRLMTDLLPNFLKSLRGATHHSSFPSGEREFSFDETPLFNFKAPRSASMRFRYLPHIPCINPSITFDGYDDNDDDDDDDGVVYDRNAGVGFYGSDGEEDCESEKSGYELNGGELLGEGEEGIDSKAEEFITRFYEQMRLQRQASYLQYYEMLERGAG